MLRYLYKEIKMIKFSIISLFLINPKSMKSILYSFRKYDDTPKTKDFNSELAIDALETVKYEKIEKACSTLQE